MNELISNIGSWFARNGTASDWLTSFGTIGAVGTSLYYSYRKERTKAKVTLDYIDELTYGEYGELRKSGRKLARIILRNTGNNSITLSAIELKMHETIVIETLDILVKPNDKFVYDKCIIYSESRSKYIRFQFRDINGKVYRARKVEWNTFKKTLKNE